MTSPIRSLIETGTKVWLDSVDPDLVRLNRQLGATGATSNPIIISDLIKTGRFDDELKPMLTDARLEDADAAWWLTDKIVCDAQRVFFPIWKETDGDDGYVSFELDPLLEDPDSTMPQADRTEHYIELGRRWSTEHDNRMIKVPATPAGLGALETLAAEGVSLNVTLIFTMKQYKTARDAVWRGAQRRTSLDRFKSVYSIFVSRVDVYTEKHVPDLTPAAQGLVGIVGAKRIWRENHAFWSQHQTPLRQEMIFASTGTKKPDDPPWKYVMALAGSDIQTNPPATNEAVETSGRTFRRTIDEMPAQAILDDIDAKVDIQQMEDTLMSEGIAKFADPQKALLKLIAEKRNSLGNSAHTKV